MTPITFSHPKMLRYAAMRPPDYLWRLAECIVSVDDRGTTYDKDHPAYQAMQQEFKRQMPPPERIPADFDPAHERRRLKAGGCCGKPRPAGE